MSAERLRQAAAKVRDAAERCGKPGAEARSYEWQMAKASLSMLGFTREAIALAVADGLDDAATDLERLRPGWKPRESTLRLVGLILGGAE